MKTIVFVALSLISVKSFCQTQSYDLRWAGGTPALDFSNDATIPYDARIILYNDNLLLIYGSDLGLPEGSLNVTSADGGVFVNGSGTSYLKLADYNAGNPSMQLVTDWSIRQGAMIVNNWGNSSNPGVSVGTTRANDGVAFSVVRNVALTSGLPSSDGETIVTVLGNGNMGVGTTAPDAKLAVNGQVHATEVRVTATVPGPDYVFEKGYDLTPMSELKAYIEKNKHLPEVPSAKQMEAEGINVGEMNLLLLKKIEEMTLYMLEMKEEIERLKGK